MCVFTMFSYNQKFNTKSLYKGLCLFVVAFMMFAPRVILADSAKFTRAEANYDISDVTVIRQDGAKLLFNQEINDGRPVLVNFVFTSCSAICPMLSHIFSKVQGKLTKEGQKFHLVTISIDPENDTPSSLTEYAKKFSAGPNWDFYTGTREASLTLQKAFKAYRGDKMNHASLILLRSAPGQSWVRLEGFVSPDEVVSEFNGLLAVH